MSYYQKVAMQEMQCGNCHILYSIPMALHDKAKESGESFCCPKGHSQHFGNSQGEKDRETIENLEARLEHAKLAQTRTENSLRTHKGINTKLRKQNSALNLQLKKEAF